MLGLSVTGRSSYFYAERMNRYHCVNEQSHCLSSSSFGVKVLMVFLDCQPLFFPSAVDAGDNNQVGFYML